MNGDTLYVLATFAAWLGWFFGIRAIILLAQVVSKAPGLDQARLSKNLVISSLIGAAGLAFSALAPKPIVGKTDALWHLPIVWLVMPVAAWFCIVSLVFTGLRAAQSTMSTSPEDRTAKLKATGIWAAVLVLGFYLYKSDKTNTITVLKGNIPFEPTTACAIILLAIAGVFAMVIAGRATKTRGYSKTIVTQATLIAGSLIFGVPFAFLVITSFKEDRDMSSPNGIVWIPRVQDTVPYKDPKNPMYEGLYNGEKVQGNIIDRKGDTVRVDIFKPMAIRGITFETQMASLKEVPKDIPVVTAKIDNIPVKAMVIEEMNDGRKRVSVLEPANMANKEAILLASQTEPVRHIGLRTKNYSEALDFLPLETKRGLVYLKNTLVIVILSVFGAVLSSAIVAYAFSRMVFPGKELLFAILLSTMMLPGAVTLLPQFLIFKQLGWIDTLYPLWVPAFFGSAYNIFLLRQFFKSIPMELEDAAKIDGCSYLKTFWSIMLPMIKPALAVVAIGTVMGAWNNFMGPLIYINSPENMPLSYALQLFNGERSGEPGMLMAFATMTMIPILLLFFFAQRYFIEGVTLSGLGGR